MALPFQMILLGLDAPDRRLVRLVLAWLAGSVDAVVEGGDNAAAPLGAFGREIGLVDGLDPQSVDEAVGEIVGDVDLVGVDLGAALSTIWTLPLAIRRPVLRL